MLVIDAYNLLHAVMPPDLAGLDVTGLCRLLVRGPWRAGRMVVVCDGEPNVLGLVESPEDAVELVYSGPRRTADDVIVDLIDADSAPRRMIVVSSDRAIQRAARRRRAKVTDSDAFVHELLRVWRRPAPPRRADPVHDMLDPEEVDQWLETFGVDDDEEGGSDTAPWWDRFDDQPD